MIKARLLQANNFKINTFQQPNARCKVRKPGLLEIKNEKESQRDGVNGSYK